MKSGTTSFGAGIQASGHEPKNSRLRKPPNPRNRMLSCVNCRSTLRTGGIRSTAIPSTKQQKKISANRTGLMLRPAAGIFNREFVFNLYSVSQDTPPGDAAAPLYQSGPCRRESTPAWSSPVLLAPKPKPRQSSQVERSCCQSRRQQL